MTHSNVTVDPLLFSEAGDEALVLASAVYDLPPWSLWVGLGALGLGLLGVLAMAVPSLAR
jgi:hypothetical protein